MSMPVHLFTLSIVGGTSGVSGDMSAPITSKYTDIDEAVSYSIQAVFTGAPVGTIQLEASNDILLSSAAGPVNWTVIPTTVQAISPTTGNYMVNVELPAYSFVQLVYTPISGTGSMTANINAKRR
jgi:hypothetical protein